MPSPNIVKKYVAGGYYHVYNRGVAKTEIFLDSDDYFVLLNIFSHYLKPSDDVYRTNRRKLLVGGVDCLAYCLMPNHFHLLLKQESESDITNFMRCTMNAYVRYFNNKYDRTGGLFESIVKAAYVDEDPYLTHASRYIHTNSIDLGRNPETYPFSSYQSYLHGTEPAWLNSRPVIEQFASRAEYHKFVRGYQEAVNEVQPRKAVKVKL